MKTNRPQHAVSKELLREKARLIRLEALSMTEPFPAAFHEAHEPDEESTPGTFSGGSNTLREGKHATVLAIGNLVSASLDAADILRAEGIELGVVDMYSIAPIDKDAIRRAAKAHGVVITAEEHNISSGFGSAVAEVIAEEGLNAKLLRIGMPDQYSLLGPPTSLYRHYGLDAEGVVAVVRKAIQ